VICTVRRKPARDTRRENDGKSQIQSCQHHCDGCRGHGSRLCCSPLLLGREIGPYDWPKSMPDESNRVYSLGGFSMVVPEGWRSGAGSNYISACSGAADYYSTQLFVEMGIPDFSQPKPLPKNASFQGRDAYQQNHITRETETSRPFFESKTFIERHGEVFQIRVRTWRRPLPTKVPDSLQRYIETFSYAPPDVS
jgi:hypothetical protein